MLVCPKCKVEMVCKKNSIAVRYNANGEHVYQGDLFKCPSCESEVVNTNNSSYFDPGASTEQPQDVWMDVDGIGYEPK